MIALSTPRASSSIIVSGATNPAPQTDRISVLQPSGQPHDATFFAANSEIFGQGEKAGALYQVVFGAVRIYRLLADGRRQISAFHFAGEVFGLEPGDRHEFFAEAITNAGVRIIRPTAQMDLSHELLPVALKSLARAQRHLLVLGRQTAQEKVAAFLLDMADRQGNDIHVDLLMQRCDIGDYLGLTLETVSRVFSKFKDKRIIKLTSARSIEILDADALEDMSE